MGSPEKPRVQGNAASNGQMVPPRCLILGEVTTYAGLLAQELSLRVELVRNSAAALQALTEQSCDIALVDLHTPRVHGLRFLETIERQRLPLTVIGVADPADIHQTVQAMRLGIRDVLPAPLCPEQLLAVLRRVLADRAARLEAAEAVHRGRLPNLLGHSPAMAE